MTERQAPQPAPPEDGAEDHPPRRRRWPVIAVVVAVGALGYFFAFGLTRDPTTLASALVDRPAPDVALEDMDTGEVVRLRDFRGQVVVVNFWASWCAACRREHPALIAAWQRYRDRGVVMLGILYQDTVENARAYLRELGGGWPTLLDPSSRAALEFGVAGIPETFFIGRDGWVAYKHVGESTYEVLTTSIHRLLTAEGEATGGSR